MIYDRESPAGSWGGSGRRTSRTSGCTRTIWMVMDCVYSVFRREMEMKACDDPVTG